MFASYHAVRADLKQRPWKMPYHLFGSIDKNLILCPRNALFPEFFYPVEGVMCFSAQTVKIRRGSLAQVGKCAGDTELDQPFFEPVDITSRPRFAPACPEIV